MIANLRGRYISAIVPKLTLVSSNLFPTIALALPKKLQIFNVVKMKLANISYNSFSYMFGAALIIMGMYI
jgi:hypothetical protein